MHIAAKSFVPVPNLLPPCCFILCLLAHYTTSPLSLYSPTTAELHNQQDNAAGMFFSFLQTHRHYQSPTWERDKVLHLPVRRQRPKTERNFTAWIWPHLGGHVSPITGIQSHAHRVKQCEHAKMRLLRIMNGNSYFLKTSTFLSLCKFIVQQSRLSLNEN